MSAANTKTFYKPIARLFRTAALVVVAVSGSARAASGDLPASTLGPAKVAAVQRALLAAQGADGRKIMRVLAKCLIYEAGTQDQKRIAAFLKLSPDTPAGKSVGQSIVEVTHTTCGQVVSGSLMFSPQLLRGSLLREIYLKEASGGRPFAASDEIRGNLAFRGGEGFAPVQRFADCVVAQNRSAAASVIGAKAGSAEENAAYHALRPALNDCIAPAEQVSFSKAVLESALAEALFKSAPPSTASQIARAQ